MLKRRLGVLAKSILAASLCATSVTPVWAQGRGTSPNNIDLPAEVQQRSEEIQKIMDRSNERFQAAETHFKQGDYNSARRAYDRSIDIILESGVSVQSDARLKQYYQNLVEHIFQRQLALIKSSSTPTTAIAVNNPQNTPGQATPASQPQPNGARGFGQQLFEASPLDELANLKLTEQETKGATAADVQSAATAAKLDFSFKPNALIQSFINYYSGRGRTTMEVGLRRSGKFMDMARNIFREEGVPQDIAWLAQVESAWSPFARSWAAAVGLW